PISRGVPPTPSQQDTPTPQLVAEETYTSTNQVKPITAEQAASAIAESEANETASRGDSPEGAEAVTCPTTSEAIFDLIPIEGPHSEHPDTYHADFDLAIRGYAPVSKKLEFVFYYGDTDPEAPQLAGIFQPHRQGGIIQGYQVNDWRWSANECGGEARGCQAEPIDEWDITLAGMATTPGEPISIASRGPEIYRGGFKALVIYASDDKITVVYTRNDTVGTGYALHLEGLCVDPNLVGLYRAQNSPDGWRTSGWLPALRNDQLVGIAAGNEIRVAIRDRGSFMDPRSSKDWWR
ncbi:MAG: hypothetical protein AAF485_20540, partial [Chloroflexota bacterium]